MPAARSTHCRSHRRQRGAVALELALILPLLITIVLGCIDFGRFSYTYISVTNAAREGAGFASMHPPPQTDPGPWITAITAAVLSELGTSFDASKVTVANPNVSNDGSGVKRVRVEVSYPFEMIIPWPLLPNSLTLTRAVEMRMIR
jgi:Flp pilus assembly protein TadG